MKDEIKTNLIKLAQILGNGWRYNEIKSTDYKHYLTDGQQRKLAFINRMRGGKACVRLEVGERTNWAAAPYVDQIDVLNVIKNPKLIKNDLCKVLLSIDNIKKYDLTRKENKQLQENEERKKNLEIAKIQNIHKVTSNMSEIFNGENKFPLSWEWDVRTFKKMVDESCQYSRYMIRANMLIERHSHFDRKSDISNNTLTLNNISDETLFKILSIINEL